MEIVIPAKPDGNEALNAFAFGVLNLVKNGNINLQAIKSLYDDTTLADNFLNFYKPALPTVPVLATVILENQINLVNLNADLCDKEVTYTNVQEKLTKALHNYAVTLLQSNKNGKRLLFKSFKNSFLKYCAKKFGITICEQDYANSMGLGVSNVYIFDNIDFIQDEFSAIFDELLKITPTNLKQLENFLNQTAIKVKLSTSWSGRGGKNLKDNYLDMLTKNLLGIGEIELKLLAKKFEIDIKFKYGEKYKFLTNKFKKDTIVLYNEFDLESSSLSLVIENVPPASLNDYDWCLKIRRCYQFLDNIFDEKIENLGYGDNFQPDNTAGYINFNDKSEFFKKFREKFTDEKSQIYGWRGLATWVAAKDIEARNSKRSDGLNHTMEEFWNLSEILDGLKEIKYFAERTSIPHFPLSNFNAKDVTLLKQLVGLNPIIAANIALLNINNFKNFIFTISEINEIRLTLYHVPPPDNIIANILSNKIIPNNNELIDVKRANFTYRTQKNLVRNRYIFAKYIEYAGDPSKFIMHFHLNLKDKDPEMKKEVRKKLGIYRDNEKIKRNIKPCFRQFYVCFYQCKKAYSKTDSNLYTYEGWSVRKCYNLVWLAVLVMIISIPFILAITLPRGLYKLANEPDNSGKKTAYDILNPFSSIFLSILIGSYLIFAINKGHENTHNLYHDRDERHEYHKDMAKILFSTKLYNIIERFELKVDHDVLNNINRLKGLFSILGRPFTGLNLVTFNEIKALPSERLQELRYKKRCKLRLSKKYKEFEQLERFVDLIETLGKQPLLPFQQAEFLELAYPLLSSLYSRKSFEDPYINNNVEKVIIDHINDATSSEKNPIEDITQNTGESLQLQRIRRSYIKWDAGVRIKEAIQKKQIKEFYRHYGLFDMDDRIQNDKSKIGRPVDCYSFDDCYELAKFDNLTEITQQLPFNAFDIP